jgi:hypothetical protein
MTLIKTSFAALEDLVIMYKGDAEKAWDEWVYDEWRFNLPYGYKVKGRNWQHLTAEDVKESLEKNYRDMVQKNLWLT